MSQGMTFIAWRPSGLGASFSSEVATESEVFDPHKLPDMLMGKMDPNHSPPMTMGPEATLQGCLPSTGRVQRHARLPRHLALDVR